MNPDTFRGQVPRISVVMAVYNAAAHLAETLDSILAQTESDLELIVIDDGSKDGTAEILDRYSAGDARVRVVHHENHGLTHALIEGCALARAPLIARQDAGDVSAADRLERQAKLFETAENLVFASCWTEFVGPEMEPLFTSQGSGFATSPAKVLDPAAEPPMLDGPSHHGSVMFRADSYRAVGGYRAAFRYGQDWDLWYRLASEGEFQMLSAFAYRARILPDSISVAARGPQFLLADLSLEAMRARSRGDSEGVIIERASRIGPRKEGPSRGAGPYFIGEALRRRGDRRARRYLVQALMKNPFRIRYWIRFLQSFTTRLR